MFLNREIRKVINFKIYSKINSEFFQNKKTGVNIILKSSVIFSVYSDLSNEKYSIKSKEGDNLLDSINEVGIPNISVFGVCNKQLACHSCAVHITKLYEKLNKPSQEEQDVHCELGDLYKENCTRMSCQIFLDRNMNGMEVKIPRSAFFFFNQKEEKK